MVQRPFSASRSNLIPQIYRTVCGFEEIRKELKHHPYNRRLSKLAIEMVLDYSIRFSKEILEIQNSTGVSGERELRSINRLMYHCITVAIIRGYLRLRKIHGYLHEIHVVALKISR